MVGSHADVGILTASDTFHVFVLQEVTNVAGAERDFLLNVQADEPLHQGWRGAVGFRLMFAYVGGRRRTLGMCPRNRL
jgi:hypothetical protein